MPGSICPAVHSARRVNISPQNRHLFGQRSVILPIAKKTCRCQTQFISQVATLTFPPCFDSAIGTTDEFAKRRKRTCCYPFSFSLTSTVLREKHEDSRYVFSAGDDSLSQRSPPKNCYGDGHLHCLAAGSVQLTLVCLVNHRSRCPHP